MKKIIFMLSIIFAFTSCSNEVAELKLELENSESKNKELQVRLENCESEKEELEQKVSDLENELHDCETRFKKYRRNIDLYNL